jgi:SAM-dependent methyltransferase
MSDETAGAGFAFRAHGKCPVCRTDTEFVALRDKPIAEPYVPSWLRDSFKCSNCQSLPRHRALVSVLEMLYPNWRALTMHESSPTRGGASGLFRAECINYTATQFDPKLGSGNTHPSGRYRSEDLERQTFADESFDLVVTQDVFEHLFHPDLAIQEIARTLKPGGAYLMTVPLANRSGTSERRARLTNTGVEYLKPASYHGNPMSADGSLVTIDWGYDILDYLAQQSGLSATMHCIDDLSRGIRAKHIEVIICRKLENRSNI